MERNRPEPTILSAEPTVEPSIVAQCEMPGELKKLTQQLEQLEHRCAWQEKYLKELSEARYSYPTRTQMDELLKSMQHLETMTEQAGKKKEKRFSLPRFRLPRLYLPEPSACDVSGRGGPGKIPGLPAAVPLSTAGYPQRKGSLIQFESRGWFSGGFSFSQESGYPRQEFFYVLPCAFCQHLLQSGQWRMQGIRGGV